MRGPERHELERPERRDEVDLDDLPVGGTRLRSEVRLHEVVQPAVEERGDGQLSSRLLDAGVALVQELDEQRRKTDTMLQREQDRLAARRAADAERRRRGGR